MELASPICWYPLTTRPRDITLVAAGASLAGLLGVLAGAALGPFVADAALGSFAILAGAFLSLFAVDTTLGSRYNFHRSIDSHDF